MDIDDKLTLARVKLWTPDLDRLLRRWKDQIGKRQEGHTRQARKFSRRHYILGIPTTLVGAIVSIGILSTFRKCSSCQDLNSTRCEIDQWIRLFVGIIGVVSTGLSALMTFMNYQEASEQHKDAANEFENLHRVIETLLQVPGSVRGDPVSTLHNLREQYTTLVRRSPQLPKKYDVDLVYKFNHNLSEGPKPPKPGDIPDESQSNPLKKLLKDDMSLKSFKKSSKDSDQENEVSIGFDLDSAQSLAQNKVALKAALLATEREKQVQQSLSKALEFELQRLDTHVETEDLEESEDLEKISSASEDESFDESSSKSINNNSS